MPAVAPPRVAIIIPCFNDGATIEVTVASARAQTEPVELVVVDDGSTDADTLTTMDRLRDQQITVVRQENSGLGPARMTGVAATTAPYVLPLDADDILLPGSVTMLADELDRHPDLGAAWGWFHRFGDETTVQRTAPDLDPWLISFRNELPATSLVRRAALDETDGWISMRPLGYEDWDLWMSLAERGWRGTGLPIVVYGYRRDGTRMAHGAVAKHQALSALLRSRHPRLYAERRALRARSTAPWLVRTTLPILDQAPLPDEFRRLVEGAMCHVGYGHGFRALGRRVLEQLRTR